MQSRRLVLISTFVAAAMIVCGLVIGLMWEGPICLSIRPDPEDTSDKVFEVWSAKRVIEKGQDISIDDFYVSERKASELPDNTVRVWFRKVAWVSVKDMQPAEILLETDMEAKDPDQLLAFLENGLKLQTEEKRRSKYLLNHLKPLTLVNYIKWKEFR